MQCLSACFCDRRVLPRMQLLGAGCSERKVGALQHSCDGCTHDRASGGGAPKGPGGSDIAVLAVRRITTQRG